MVSNKFNRTKQGTANLIRHFDTPNQKVHSAYFVLLTLNYFLHMINYRFPFSLYFALKYILLQHKNNTIFSLVSKGQTWYYPNFYISVVCFCLRIPQAANTAAPATNKKIAINCDVLSSPTLPRIKSPL